MNEYKCFKCGGYVVVKAASPLTPNKVIVYCPICKEYLALAKKV